MGSLLILNDDDKKTFWRKNIFKLEIIIIIESILNLFLSVLTAISFPFDTLKITNKKSKIMNVIYICIFSSLAALIISLLIKRIHIKTTIKPNYRLCIMHFLSFSGLFIVILYLILSLYISSVIHKWANLYEFVQYKNIGKVIYIFVLNNFIILLTIFEFVDLLLETIMISKVSKFLSIGNNINNHKLLFELFKINSQNYNYDKIEENNLFNKKNEGNETFKKLRIIFPKNKDENHNNTFENNINKFREVELIEKVEYKSIGIQTKENKDKSYTRNININVEEDLSKNIILVKNKSLINSSSTSE